MIRTLLGCLASTLGMLAVASPCAADYVGSVLADGPVGYWRMNETYGAATGQVGPIYNDATGSAAVEDANWGYYDFGDTAGSDVGAAGPQSPAYLGFEADNRAAWFDGVNDMVYIDNKPAYQITGPLTLEAWVNPDGSTVDQSVVGKFSMNGNQRSYLMQVLDTGSARFIVSPAGQASGNVYVDSTAKVSAGQWTHVAATFSPSGADNFMRIYVNGTLRGQLTTGLPASIYSSSTAVRIGDHYGSTAGTAFYDGKLDEVAIYNQALSGPQVAAHVLAAVRVPGSGLVHLPLDETAGTTAADASSHGNTGTLTGSGFSFAARSVAGPFGQALQFNGTSDYLRITNGGNLPGPGSPFTVSFWAKAPDWDAQNGIVASYHLNGLEFSIGLHDASNGLIVGVDSSSSDLQQGLIDLGSAGLNLPDNQFAHFAVVFGAGGTIDAMYVNGLATGASSSSYWFFGDADTFTLGRRVRDDSGAQFFRGALDDFAIFDRALTAAQVNAVMNSGVAAFIIPEPTSVVLTLAGLLVLVGWRRRRG